MVFDSKYPGNWKNGREVDEVRQAMGSYLLKLNFVCMEMLYTLCLLWYIFTIFQDKTLKKSFMVLTNKLL